MLLALADKFIVMCYNNHQGWFEMRKGAHTQYDIQMHIVWTTKYRYKVLEGKIALRMRELIRQGCEARKVKIIKGSVSKNHIHILVSMPPSISVSKLVQYLKGRSSKIIQEEFPVLKKRYWGQHLWGIGYFCRSVGTITDEIVKQYIEDQKDDIDDVFKIIK